MALTRRLAGALIMGGLGTAFLTALGLWQLQRLEWKRDVLARIEARIAAEPGPLPTAPNQEADGFLPVALTGRIGPDALRVVTTDAGGPAFRVVSPFDTGGRAILIDRGIVSADTPVPAPPVGPVRITGNLHWPDEADSFTPEPDRADRIWYARDVPGMAAALGAEPVLVVARDVPGDAVSPRPIGTAGIPNNHLGYAATWFSLAAAWVGMTAVLVWRITRRIG